MSLMKQNEGREDLEVLVNNFMEENKEELKKRIGEEAYRITQEKGTEMAFTGKFYKHKESGMYTCVVCGNELFPSDTKFDSRSGWPSFYDVAHSGAVERHTDTSNGMERIEVTCKKCGAHMGHVFPDGPEDLPADRHGKTGERYCINSCALNFKKK